MNSSAMIGNGFKGSVCNPNGPFVDIMLDLETLGTKPGCKILSIGAVNFNLSDSPDIQRSFYQTICVDSQDGLAVDPGTQAWWNKQSEAARKEAFKGEHTLTQALRDFNFFLESCSFWGQRVVRIWGKGKDFDAPIIKAAYEAMGLAHNWDDRFEICFRHMYSDMNRFIPKPEFKGVAHNALADAKHQADHADLIIEHLKTIGMYNEKMKQYENTLAFGERIV